MLAVKENQIREFSSPSSPWLGELHAYFDNNLNIYDFICFVPAFEMCVFAGFLKSDLSINNKTSGIYIWPTAPGSWVWCARK